MTEVWSIAESLEVRASKRCGQVPYCRILGGSADYMFLRSSCVKDDGGVRDEIDDERVKLVVMACSWQRVVEER